MSEVAKRLFTGIKPTDLAELQTAIITALQHVKKANPDKELWLVSGRVSPAVGSENPVRERRSNEVALRRKRMNLQRDSDNRLYFTSADIMPPIRDRLKSSPSKEFIKMWRKIVKLGYVDGVYMTAGAELSTGARVEYKTARRRGLYIEYETPQVQQALSQKCRKSFAIIGW